MAVTSNNVGPVFVFMRGIVGHVIPQKSEDCLWCLFVTFLLFLLSYTHGIWIRCCYTKTL